MKRHLILAELASTPWAMAPEYLTSFSAVLHRWAAGAPATPGVMADVQAAQAARAARRQSNANIGGGIAVLPLYGVLTQRASLVDDISGSGGTSTQRFSQAFRDAMDDDAVSGIILDIDSPGGSVFGTAELASEIMDARGKKPVFGFVNSLCASAAYWIGSACAELYITQGGQAGSIGVYMEHVDISKAMEMSGLKSEYIQAGKFKTEGNPYGPLTDEARGFMQSQIDAYYKAFTSAVAKGRGVPVATVRDGMGQGRCLMAADAVSEKMVDGIDTMDGVIARMSKAIRGGPGARADVLAPEIGADSQAAQPSAEVAQPADPTPQADSAARRAARRRALEIASL
jgi:signal peptide peptidase SppA